MNEKNQVNESNSGMLSDNEIRKYFKSGINITTEKGSIIEFDLDKQLHIGSVDLHFRGLHRKFVLPKGEVLSFESLKKNSYTEPHDLKVGEKLIINPGEIIIATTVEIVHLTEDFAAIITGRSSIAKLGIMVHCCQEFIHPGHGQAIPLQLINLGSNPVELDMEIPVCQIVFFKLASSASEKYIDRKDAKYSKEINPQTSKIYQESYDNVNNKESNGNVNSIDIEGKDKHIFKSFVKKIYRYILPFLPPIIMFIGITPLIQQNLVGKSIGSVLKDFINAPITTIIAIALVIFYIMIKKGEDK